MTDTYSTYDAKARFSELLRKVRSGQTVFIQYRGEIVAELKPIDPTDSMEEKIRRLEERGLVTRAAPGRKSFKPIADRPGALTRFLEERE